MKKMLGVLFAICLVFVLLFGCVSNSEGGSSNSDLQTADRPIITENTDGSVKTSLFAMDTYMEILALDSDKKTAQAMVDEIQGLEDELSVTDEHSVIFEINKNGNGVVSGNVHKLLKTALEMCADTDGEIDITIYPVVKAWGFTTSDFRVPNDDEILELLKYVDYSSVSLEGNTVKLQENAQIDLGAVAKGYTADKVAEILRDNGVKSALINLGGNIYAIGKKQSGEKWQVGIKSPNGGDVLGVISCKDRAVVTSGGYERYFEQNGNTYWHIIDPKTGKPAKNGLESVSVIGKDATKCDALSTSLFVMGLDKASEYLICHTDFDAIFVDEDGDIFVTEGIKNDFSLYGKYVGKKVKVIK